MLLWLLRPGRGEESSTTEPGSGTWCGCDPKAVVRRVQLQGGVEVMGGWWVRVRDGVKVKVVVRDRSKRLRVQGLGW